MRILYLCNWTGESGGIEVLYDHVRLLRRLGFDARLASYGAFRRCTWFEHDPAETPALPRFLDELTPDDCLVLPEICMWDRELAHVRCRLVVLVQNPDLMTGPAGDPRYAAMLVPSGPLLPWLRDEKGYAGPLHLVPGFLDSRWQVYVPARARRPSPRETRFLVIDRPDKNHGEPELVRAELERLNRRVTYVSERMPRRAFVRLFHEHDVYLHLSYREGFPISFLEAFAAGCLVVGFDGRGGREFLRDGWNARLVPDRDWRAALQRALASDALDDTGWRAYVDNGRATAASYPEAQTSAALERAFGGILAARVRAASP